MAKIEAEELLEQYKAGAPNALMGEKVVEVKVVKAVPVLHHRTGISSVQVYTAEDKLHIDYHGTYSNHKGSATVSRAVKEQLSNLGMQCQIDKTERDVTCEGPLTETPNLPRLAVFFRLLTDADLAHGAVRHEAIKKIKDVAWKQAGEAQKPFLEIGKINWNQVLNT